MSTVLITGSNGFIGAEIVNQLLVAGHEVIAVVRPGKTSSMNARFDSTKLKIVELDLANTNSLANVLSAATSNIELDAIVYASGSMAGDDTEHEKNSISPLKSLLDFMELKGCSKLVHLSSFSVYGFSAMPSGSTLDETTPMEAETEHRDAYCRSKRKQEDLLIEATQSRGFSVTSLRLGMVYDLQNLWSPRIGYKLMGTIVHLNKNAILPLCHVINCAHAVVSSITARSVLSDVFIPSNYKSSANYEIINVVDTDLPTVFEFMSLIRKSNLGGIHSSLALPTNLVDYCIRILNMLQEIAPSVYSKLPGVLKKQGYDARFKALFYNNARLRNRVNDGLVTLKTAMEAER